MASLKTLGGHIHKTCPDYPNPTPEFKKQKLKPAARLRPGD